MSAKNMAKILGLIVGTCLIYMLIFGRPFLNLRLAIIGGDALRSALGITLAVAAAPVFIYLLRRILIAPELTLTEAKEQGKSFTTLEDCDAAIDTYIKTNIATFREDLGAMRGQTARMLKKEVTVQGILTDKFDAGEMTYAKFAAAVSSAKEIMITNIKCVIQRISAFDEEDFDEAGKIAASPNEKIAAARRDILNEYRSFVKQASANNEEIILRMDQLILELTKLNTLSGVDLSEVDALKELDALIKGTKLYHS